MGRKLLDLRYVTRPARAPTVLYVRPVNLARDRHRVCIPAALLLLVATLACGAEPLAQPLPASTAELRTRAEQAEAALLAPTHYGRAVAALERAERARSGGRAGEVEELLREAAAHFSGAERSAREAQRTFAEPLARREAARSAEVFRLAGPAWAKAESKLSEAARRLEKADVEGALARAREAGVLYADAELRALKATLLTEARSLVLGLEQGDTARLAPRTTQRARELLRQAENELDADRTRREQAAELAAKAADEARHATALAAYLRSHDAGSAEDLVLEWEAALTRTAQAAGAAVDFARGPQAASDALAASVTALQEHVARLSRELEERARHAAGLEEEIRELDSRLAGLTSTTRSLTEQLEARERKRAQFEALESLFPSDQALVLRQGDSIIVRAHGLAFASGSSRLASGARTVLEKLRQVVAIYPGARFTVEGHTDSSGDRATNQRLSQARAEAVLDYLVNELAVPAGRVTAIGYGDTRPVANNDTAQGRRLNRRIDLVITPPREAGG
jgi:outer membrane protein OmpA-like peptidoglycan-associated protein